MDKNLKSLLGILDDGKRIYRFLDGEVTKDEFDYCCALDQLLFGEGGYIETLGPTWELIHDPRFSVIENAFIVNRRAVFGGDAKQGKQYISSDGTFTSTIADLEQYSEVLGEGRYFYYVLTHPNTECPVRSWYVRIFPELVAKEGIKVPNAGEDLTCNCVTAFDPHEIKTAPDEVVWDLIKQECPNYFDREGKPNAIAVRLYDLFRADLLGLIADYAVTPLSDAYIELDTGDVLNQDAIVTESKVVPRVFLEVDILEKALTQRAILRATAAKVLRQIGFQKTLKELGNLRLTDLERDQLLHLIYTPPKEGMFVNPGDNWYGFLYTIKPVVKNFLQEIKKSGKDFEERQQEQLQRASEMARGVHTDLIEGRILPINQFTEPEVEVTLDPHAAVMAAILKNPLKQELFLMWAEAEQRGETGPTDDDKLRMRKLHSILTPVFTDPNFIVNEEEFNHYIEQAVELGYFTVPRSYEVEEEFDGKKGK